MKRPRFGISLNDRQKKIAAATVLIGMVAIFLEQWTFPAYDRWRQQSSLLVSKAATYGRLSRNFSIKDRVDREFSLLSEQAFRSGSDEVTLADFLKRVETAAGGQLVKVEPSPVEGEGVCSTYRVRLLLSGKLQGIVRFADEITGSGDSVGIESFSLRAIPGRNMCDCTFTLWMVRLSSSRQSSAHHRAATDAVAPAGGEGDG